MMKARHAGVWGLFVVAHVVGAVHSSGQDADAWRAPFAAGEAARVAGDAATYASEMAAAAEVMPAGHLNRPFVQYHAARASALSGDADAAVTWLRRAWDEDIEALMISFAPYDPAFADMIDSDGFERVMALPAAMELGVRPLRGGLHLVEGAGANLLVQVGDDGVLMVDTGYEPALPALRSAVEELGGGGVDLLIVTHPHEDHMGATPELGADAIVLAHPGTTAQMREPYVFMEGVEMPPKVAAAYPDREVASDTTLTFNGESIRLVPTVAHTAGDLSVYFADARVVHFGDTYLPGNPMMFPGTDDPDGFLDDLDAFIASMAPETIVVPGHEAVTDLDAVRAQIDTSRACMAFVRSALEEGLTLEETAERGADRFAPQWIAFFYRLESQPG